MPPRILSIVIFFLVSALIAAAEDIQCSADTPLFGKKYDFTSFNIAMTVERTRNTPPSQTVDSLMFNICADLPPSERPAGDQCPAGTRACLTQMNQKKDQQDRIVAVIPLATSSSLDPRYQVLSDRTGFTIFLHGEPYPEDGVPQSFNLTLLCGTVANEPVFIDYDGKAGTVEWSTPAACSQESPGDSPEPDPSDGSAPRSSGIGWFFLLFFLAFGAYFTVGAYHNYTNYGASGWDLIPHRDFWRDVPFLLRDLAQHLMNAVRGGPSRGGYHAV